MLGHYQWKGKDCTGDFLIAQCKSYNIPVPFPDTQWSGDNAYHALRDRNFPVSYRATLTTENGIWAKK